MKIAIVGAGGVGGYIGLSAKAKIKPSLQIELKRSFDCIFKLLGHTLHVKLAGGVNPHLLATFTIKSTLFL